ncbi:MAG: hypothetical protein KC486_05520 [Myxococcales bacterium]|nr:hypothetical protein [Myxococcales bacterium]
MTSRGGSGDDGGISSLVRRSLKEVVARWAVRHRAPRPTWLRPQDEAMHPWDGRRHFAEEYVFAAVQRDLGILVRLEWLPGRESHRVWVILFEEGAVYTLPGSGQAIVRGGESGNWRVGGLEIDCVEPFQRWRVGFRGKLDRRTRDGEPLVVEDAAGAKAVDRVEARLDLTFLADHPPFIPGTDDDPELLSRSLGGAAWDVDLLRGLRRRQMRSYVQVGELAGTVVLGDRILAIDSSCLRQHGWGVRDWGASDQALHCFVSRGGRPHVWIHRADFPWLTLEGGFVAGADGLQAIADLGVTLERRPEQAPRRIGVDIELRENGRREDVAFDGECLAQLALEMDGRGRLYLAFLRVGDGDAGIWIGQRRTLPRPEPR